MEMTEWLTIAEAGRQIRSRQLSPVELFRYCMERIHRYEAKLNTFITVLEDAAQKQAEQAERDIMAGNYRGPLHGIPISLKDIIAYAGCPMTNGSRIAPEYTPTAHATVAQKLVDAGTVMMGKAHLNEYAFKAPHPHYGWTRNPWDTESIPGGSSSGSGSAVQAALVLCSIGTDTGGSIRNPASYCGVVGLKPTYGLVSRYGVSPLSWTLDHIGPLTRTCEDAALMLGAMAGYDENDDGSCAAPNWSESSFVKTDSLRGKKIGVPSSYFYDNLAPDVEAAVRRALNDLETLGAELIPVAIESMDELLGAHRIILNTEAYAYHHNNLQEQPEGYGPKLRLSFELGQYFTAEAYIGAQRLRTRMRDQFSGIFAKVDALVTPTTPTAAKKIKQYENETSLAMQSMTSTANFLGLPALSLPCGFTSEGLPVGLQLMGRPFGEGDILTIGHCYEQYAALYKKLPDETHWVA
ncbi:amidase [Paenibacillus piri]|uniref:Asp-tRNA(Asn)/Glu-tRNA(Gln) amidotransferase subunit GatA n=1 Tax=Paenibacillus piri TaxID=2547395 RepID=A0A4R5KE73_9BACL|nr:amidase [Paenibacillus piri]TDF92517.1 Asp-tRNA(Asn)/Glu-tRNA(Gln) amidotransferase subunit GatA [Paenibacillus piri]